MKQLKVILSPRCYKKANYRTLTPWALSLTGCFFTFCLLATGLAAWAALDQQGQRWGSAAGAGLLYTAAALAWCGAFSGQVDRPYRLLFIVGCGWLGLLAPWALRALIPQGGATAGA